VFPVTRRLNGFAGGFFANDSNSGEPGAVIDAASRSVSRWHPAPATRINPARAYDSDFRNVNMGRLRVILNSGWSPPSRSANIPKTAVVSPATHPFITKKSPKDVKDQRQMKLGDRIRILS
jgi:hypothetical protein